ncbi:MAG: MATE family efflux transporter [Solobacterium sp.]|jgi:putative MATE family efflux protein|nr:MATE family efflux transporter [Solobacterium sp.]MCH4222732.1 MATE family efflux transporter [Solobacterium sp.]MCH4266314.1 MATE family efflux transporter [Solobacterium sp.]
MTAASNNLNMTKLPVYKAVAKLAIPTVLSSLVMVIYNLADTYFVGMLNDPVMNAAVTLASPLILAFNAVNNLFGVGASSLLSRALGSNDHVKARQSASFGIYGALCFSILYALICYFFRSPILKLLGATESTAYMTYQYMKWAVILNAVPAIVSVVFSYLVRAEGAAGQASLGISLGAILNIILDPIFALPFGLNLGAEGVGIATFISNCVACTYFIIILYRKRKTSCIQLSPKYFTLNRSIVTGVFSVGISASIQNLLNVTGMTILNNFTASYGTNAVAAMGITQKINLVPMYISLGVSQGVSPLIGYTYASENYDYMKKTILFSVKLMLCVSVSASIILFLGGSSLTALFISNTEIIEYGGHLLQAFSISLPFQCIDFLAVCVFQATGNGKSSLIFAIMRKIVLEIPCMIIFNKIIGLYGLPYGQVVAEFCLAIAAVFMLKKFFTSLKHRTPRAA